MKKLFYTLFLMITVLFISGCFDISDRAQAGNFGNTQEESTAVSAITQKYGELTQRGDPRFLEPVMTTRLNNFIPMDEVIAYSNTVDEFNVWFVYDNFNNDNLEIEWIYLDNDHSIHTFQSTTGDNFGRASFVLERPLGDDTWPTGEYKVLIRGRGIEESINFDVVKGDTKSKPFALIEEFDADLDEIEEMDDMNEIVVDGSFEDDLTYEDPNYPISFDYPSDYGYSVENGNVVFEKEAEDMYFVLSVVYGYESVQEVKDDYFQQLMQYEPTIVSEDVTKRNGRYFKEFEIEYFHEEVYKNEYMIGKSDGMYYILQFVTPERLNRINMIRSIKDTFIIDGNDELKEEVKEIDESMEYDSEHPSGNVYNKIHEDLINVTDEQKEILSQNHLSFLGGKLVDFDLFNESFLGSDSPYRQSREIRIKTSSDIDRSREWVSKKLDEEDWNIIEDHISDMDNSFSFRAYHNLDYIDEKNAVSINLDLSAHPIPGDTENTFIFLRFERLDY